jgi:hypothetical protein
LRILDRAVEALVTGRAPSSSSTQCIAAKRTSARVAGVAAFQTSPLP